MLLHVCTNVMLIYVYVLRKAVLLVVFP